MSSPSRKTTPGRDVMIDSPSTISEAQLDELHLENKKEQDALAEND
jgi:aspartyl-tRNA synthetase